MFRFHRICSLTIVFMLAGCSALTAGSPGPEVSSEQTVDLNKGSGSPSDAGSIAVGTAAPADGLTGAQAYSVEMTEAEVPLFAAGADPDTMIFQDYGTNPFFDVAQDNLSTFAVDVDTGSYTLMRNYLNRGILPPSEAVRLEEYVNYFPQAYPLPQQQAFGIYIDAAPTPFSASGTVVMRIGVQGYDIAPEDRPDVTLIFVVDVSGSMDREDRLEAVKQALYTLVGQLRPTDSIGLVVYGSTGRVLLEPTPVKQSGEIQRAIAELRPDGSTNAEEGLRLAYDLASRYYSPDRLTRLVLCSDGVANVGATGPDSILASVRQQAQRGITLTTVGFGMGNYNDMLMEQLADDGDGQYFYVDSQDEAQRIFVDKLTGTLVTIARDAKIQVEFNPELVKSYRLMGYENRDVADENFRNDAVDAGEIGAGHSVTALYEVVPSLQASGVLATVRLRWEDPETGVVAEMEQSISGNEIAPGFDYASPVFRLDVAIAAFADILGQGFWAQSAGIEQVQAIAGLAAAELGGNAQAEEFLVLVEKAHDLVRE